MTSKENKTKNHSNKGAKNMSARLIASQACYQIEMLDQSPKAIIEEFLSFRIDQLCKDLEITKPDGKLFQHIVGGVMTRSDDIDNLVKGARGKAMEGDQQSGSIFSSEPLLQSIVRCAVFELLEPQTSDVPLIISDYLDVTDAFYDQNEKSLVNGLLDKVKSYLED